jgi:hypothetical protein
MRKGCLRWWWPGLSRHVSAFLGLRPNPFIHQPVNYCGFCIYNPIPPAPSTPARPPPAHTALGVRRMCCMRSCNVLSIETAACHETVPTGSGCQWFNHADIDVFCSIVILTKSVALSRGWRKNLLPRRIIKFLKRNLFDWIAGSLNS